ncbi:MAG: PQQ-binding-like beta-propeller repeat protein [Gemmatales bacterium]
MYHKLHCLHSRAPRLARSLTLPLLMVAVAFLIIPSSHAEDWPEFRGPTHQGHYPGKLPREWSEQKNVLWTAEVPGKGWSSPVIRAGRIYLTSAVPSENEEQQLLRCLCLDASTGKTLWDTELFKQDEDKAPKIHSKNSHASPTPLVTAEHVYVHFGHMGTACLNLTGKVVWKNNEYRYKPVHGNGGSPCLVNDHLIFSCDGDDLQAVIALDARTGATRWKVDRKANPGKRFSFGTPLAIEIQGKTQVICPGSDVVMALDPATGAEFWRLRYKGYSQIPRPLYANGLLYICTGYDSPQVLAIKPDGKGDVTDTHLIWKVTRNAPNTPSPVIVGDDFYMVADNGVFTCLNARNGEQRWQGRLTGGYSASLLAAGGVIYALNEQGTCFIIEPGTQFKQPEKNSITGQTLASLAAWDGKLLLRTDERLYCIGVK